MKKSEYLTRSYFQRALNDRFSSFEKKMENRIYQIVDERLADNNQILLTAFEEMVMRGRIDPLEQRVSRLEVRMNRLEA